MDSESTRALVIGLFVVTGRTELSAAELIRLARARRVKASNLKSHLTRMVQDGSLVRCGKPRSFLYAPSPSKSRVIQAIKERAESASLLRTEPWNGEWIVYAPGCPRLRVARERLRRRLRFDGYRAIHSGVVARPAWPRTACLERAGRLVKLYGGAFVIGPLEGDAARRELLRRYALPALDRRAQQILERLERALDAPPTGERALALRLELGDHVARLFSDDPRLPPELWGEHRALARLIEVRSRLERVLERASAPFLKSVLDPARPSSARSA